METFLLIIYDRKFLQASKRFKKFQEKKTKTFIRKKLFLHFFKFDYLSPIHYDWIKIKFYHLNVSLYTIVSKTAINISVINFIKLRKLDLRFEIITKYSFSIIYNIYLEKLYND